MIPKCPKKSKKNKKITGLYKSMITLSIVRRVDCASSSILSRPSDLIRKTKKRKVNHSCFFQSFSSSSRCPFVFHYTVRTVYIYTVSLHSLYMYSYTCYADTIYNYMYTYIYRRCWCACIDTTIIRDAPPNLPLHSMSLLRISQRALSCWPCYIQHTHWQSSARFSAAVSFCPPVILFPISSYSISFHSCHGYPLSCSYPFLTLFVCILLCFICFVFSVSVPGRIVSLNSIWEQKNWRMKKKKMSSFFPVSALNATRIIYFLFNKTKNLIWNLTWNDECDVYSLYQPMYFPIEHNRDREGSSNSQLSPHLLPNLVLLLIFLFPLGYILYSASLCIIILVPIQSASNLRLVQ